MSNRRVKVREQPGVRPLSQSHILVRACSPSNSRFSLESSLGLQEIWSRLVKSVDIPSAYDFQQLDILQTIYLFIYLSIEP